MADPETPELPDPALSPEPLSPPDDVTPGPEQDWKKHARTWEQRAKDDKKRAEAAEAELAKLRQAQMSDTERAIAEARAAAAAEADERWVSRVLTAEAKAAAAGKVVDVETAVQLLDLSKIPVVDGKVDSDELVRAIDALVAAKPFLAPAQGKHQTPTAPLGPRGNGKGSITREQLKTMKPEAIDAARRAGELDHLMSGS